MRQQRLVLTSKFGDTFNLGILTRFACATARQDNSNTTRKPHNNLYISEEIALDNSCQTLSL